MANKILLTSLKISFGILLLALNCNSTSIEPTYSTFDLIASDTLIIKKLYKKDYLVDADIRNHQVILYNADSACIIVYNLKTQKHKRINFFHDRLLKSIYPWSFQYNYLNDSTLTYYCESYDPLADSKVGLINLNTGSSEQNFNLDFDFLYTRNELSDKDIYNKVTNAQIQATFNPTFLKLPIHASDTALYITMLIGKTNKHNFQSRSVTNNTIRVVPKTSHKKSEIISNSFSLLSPVFNDSINPSLKEMMLPSTSCYKTSDFLFTYKGSADVIAYNYQSNESNIIKVKLPFLNLNEHPIGFHNTRMSDCFVFGAMISNPENNLMLRSVEFPQTLPKYSTTHQITRFLCFDKKLNCIGISNSYNKNLIFMGADKQSFYALDLAKTIANEDYIYLIKYDVGAMTPHYGTYKIDAIAEANQQSNNIKNYLSNISTRLIEYDTIVTIFTKQASKGSIMKVGLFLSEMQEKELSSKHPILLVSPSLPDEKEFITQFKINNQTNFYFDHDNGFLQTTENAGMGIFVRINETYQFIKYENTELNKLFAIIHNKVGFNGNICFPLK